jgi:Tfp pilus assembly protein FimT
MPVDMTTRWRFRWPTLIELLAVVAIIAVLIAVIVPATQWASSGSMHLPVNVLVFDADQNLPIANASVTIFVPHRYRIRNSSRLIAICSAGRTRRQKEPRTKRAAWLSTTNSEPARVIGVHARTPICRGLGWKCVPKDLAARLSLFDTSPSLYPNCAIKAS